MYVYTYLAFPPRELTLASLSSLCDSIHGNDSAEGE